MRSNILDHTTSRNRGLFIALTCVLLGVGVLMVYSAGMTSWPTDYEEVLISRHLLFLAIAVGLGLGANQMIPTVVASILILAVIACLRWARGGKERRNLYLSIEIPAGSEPGQHINQLNDVIARHAQSTDLRRMDSRPEGLEFTYLLDLDESRKLPELVEELNGAFPGIGLTFIDQNQLPVL